MTAQNPELSPDVCPWPLAPLRDVSLLIKDGTHGSHERIEGGVPLLSAVNVRDGLIDWGSGVSTISEADYRAIHASYELKPDDLLLTVVGSLGRRALLKQEPRFTIQRNVAVIRSNPSSLYPPFLFHLTGGTEFQTQLEVRSNSTAQAGIYLRELGSIPIPIPPLPEQKKIAEILGSVDEAIQATQAVVDQTRKVKQGLLQQLLTRGIGHTRFKQTESGQIPESWEVRRLVEVANVQTGAKGKKGLSAPVSLPYVRVANVQDGHIDLNKIKSIQVERRDIERYRLQSGDVLLTEGGDLDKLGRGGIWRGQIDPCLHQNHVFAVRTNRQELLPEHLAALIGSAFGKSYFLSCAKKTSNLASINSTQLKAFPIPLPPLDEQRRIAAVVASIQESERSYQSYVDEIDRLKCGLMQDLLTGRIRVQDS